MSYLRTYNLVQTQEFKQFTKPLYTIYYHGCFAGPSLKIKIFCSDKKHGVIFLEQDQRLKIMSLPIFSLHMNSREKMDKGLIHCEFTVHPSTTMSSHPFPLAVKGLCRDVERPRPQQLIHTQHSGGSKNVSAILGFKNTDSHRFRHNCQCSSGEEGKKNLKSIFASNQTTGLNHSRPRPVSGFIIVGKMVRK